MERLDRLAVDVLESSEKMKSNGAVGGGHSSGTSLEDRARQGMEPTSMAEVSQTAGQSNSARAGPFLCQAPVLGKITFFSLAQRPTNTDCVVFL